MHNSAINYIHVNIKNACVMVLTLTVQNKIIFESDEHLDDYGLLGYIYWINTASKQRNMFDMLTKL